ncbi:MAG: hypothetical protein OEO84_10950 [Betaproteobacteria bacterium]|nr:hypothetical protein [Betaproteobacteria bacterium]
MERITLILALAAAPAWGFDANGVTLGASEAEVQKGFPTARCKPMEWRTAAADRRCDDAPVRFGGVDARISFFLKANAVQAFDVRFEAPQLERMAQFLKEHYGPPETEARETIERRGAPREIYKLRWKQGADHAVLTSQHGRRRVDLNVWRGNFDTEVYRFK